MHALDDALNTFDLANKAVTENTQKSAQQVEALAKSVAAVGKATAEQNAAREHQDRNDQEANRAAQQARTNLEDAHTALTKIVADVPDLNLGRDALHAKIGEKKASL